MPSPRYATFALALPLYHLFDYALGPDLTAIVGMRYRLPFRHGHKVGILISVSETTEVAKGRIKPVVEALDQAAVLSTHMLDLAQWMADYYLQPHGEVLFQCLPRYLRTLRKLESSRVKVWSSIETDPESRAKMVQHAPKQAALLSAIEQSTEGLNALQLKQINPNWHTLVRALETKQAIRWHWSKPTNNVMASQPAMPLYPEQAQVFKAISAHQAHFSVHLLEGITGSGKTEVYFYLMQQTLEQQRQVLYLVPEIGLTPQLVARVKARFGNQFAISHSALSDSRRYQAWQQFRQGDIGIMLGTRSSLFSESQHLGLIIIDEEHDSSYKQEDGIHYHARDVAIKRAQMLDIPIVLGSATPSFESLKNTAREHFFLHCLTQRPDARQLPKQQLIDISNLKLTAGCSQPLLQKIRQHLNAGGQVLLYLNRRGYSPLVMCHACGWQACCDHCDSRLTLHGAIHQLLCHHCGDQRSPPKTCPQCNHPDIHHYGVGTEQLEELLKRSFSNFPVIRIDRDSTANHNAFAAHLEILAKGEPCLLVGTQMITKGHDYPAITLSVVLDADQALFSASYRATEQLIQTLFQVSGRAGRGQNPGEAWLQTRFPRHPLIQSVLSQSYREIAIRLLAQRQQLGFPPYARVVMFRADASDLDLAIAKLNEIRNQLEAATPQEVRCIGPMPALMTRRIGRYRAQLCLISSHFQKLRTTLRAAIPGIAPIANTPQVKWTVDVDAYDL